MTAIIVLILRILMILLSYLFVGWIGYSIFKDLKERTHEGRVLPKPTLSLYAELEQQEMEANFEKPDVIIGRDPTSDFLLNDETISLRHCKIYFLQHHWWVEDLKSTNGTYLNHAIIEKPAILTNGDALQLGRVEIIIKLT